MLGQGHRERAFTGIGPTNQQTQLARKQQIVTPKRYLLTAGFYLAQCFGPGFEFNLEQRSTAEAGSRDLPKCKIAVRRTKVAVDNWRADLEKTTPPECMRKVHGEEHASMHHFQTALRLVDRGLRTSNLDLMNRGTRAISEGSVHIWTAVALRDVAIRTCTAEAAVLASSASGR
jgi:hypothetical protein